MHPEQQPSALHVIESHVTMERFVDHGVGTVPLDVTLSYDPTDPFAVTVVLHAEDGAVRWIFARDLLVDGMFAPAGDEDGDVYVWPCLDNAGVSVVIVELRSPSGELMGQVPTRDLGRFVRDMLGAVPLGSEADHVDLDAVVERLLQRL